MLSVLCPCMINGETLVGTVFFAGNDGKGKALSLSETQQKKVREIVAVKPGANEPYPSAEYTITAG